VSPLFATEYHPEGNAIAERTLGSLKNLISELARDKPRSWHRVVGTCLWAVREIANGTTHVPPHLLVFGTMPRGPLAILRETWLGQRPMPDSGTGGYVSGYLEKLLDRLQTAQDFASEHAAAEQERHVKHYNLRTRQKQFLVGDECLILQKDSTASSVFSRWKGPATIKEACSPYTYRVEYD